MRDGFQELVERDLLGPWGGEYEEFRPRASGPRERYLVGMLGPKHQPRSTVGAADSLSDVESGVEGESRGEGSGELPEVLTPQNLGRIWASSMGLSFCVGTDTEVGAVTVQWGQYGKRDTEDDDGTKRTVWAREPVSHSLEVRLGGDPDVRIPLTGAEEDQPGVYLAASVRPRGGRRTVELTLVNGQAEPQSGATDVSWVFQPWITVTALDGASAVFHPIDDPVDSSESTEDGEEAHLRLLYRNQLQYAAGHNVAVHPHIEPGARRAHRLETTWLPTYNVPATEAPSGPGTPLAGTEAGTLIRGGSAPARAAEHIAELKASGVLDRLAEGS